MTAPSHRPPRATIADVAREAGVSRTTVSHTYSGLRHVSAETRALVIATAERLHYRPSVRAQRLRLGRSQAIAILSSTPSAVSGGAARLGFFTDLAMGCAQTALPRGYTLVLAPPDADDVLRRVDIDGAILLEPRPDDPFAHELDDRGIPFVTIGADPGPDNVDLHPEEVARIVFAHFAQRGALSPGIVSSDSGRPSQAVFQERYAALAAEAGFPAIGAVADERGGADAGFRATRRLLDDHPELDALFVPVDAFATGAIQAARDAGRVVGKDLLLATRYDGLRAQTSVPPLTAVDLHLAAVSEAAVSLLLRKLGDDSGEEPVTPPLPTLVARASTGT